MLCEKEHKMKELKWRLWSSPSPSQGLFPFCSLRMEIVSCLLWVIPQNQNHCLKIHNFSITDPNLSAPTCCVPPGTLGVLALTAAGRGCSSTRASVWIPGSSYAGRRPQWELASIWSPESHFLLRRLGKGSIQFHEQAILCTYQSEQMSVITLYKI